MRYALLQHRTRGEMIILSALLATYAALAWYLFTHPAVAASALAALHRALGGGSAPPP